MTHDVFISYSSDDKTVAESVCLSLEARGIRCWIAPRDIKLGADWSGALVEAIHQCQVMVLIYSANANHSKQVKREVERAVFHDKVLIPLRIEDVPPSRELEYFISTAHWMDAHPPPLNPHLERLAKSIQSLLHLKGRPEQASGGPPPGKSDGSAQSLAPSRPARWRWIALAAVFLIAVALMIQLGNRSDHSAASAGSELRAIPVTLSATEPGGASTRVVVSQPSIAHDDDTRLYERGAALYAGTGVVRDINAAAAIWRRAAEVGDARAMVAIGQMYLVGDGGLAKDPVAAMQWFQKAASLGDVGAMFHVASGSRDGLGIEKNPMQSLTWFEKAANNGHAPSMSALGALYMKGDIIPQDGALAALWLRKAVDAGDVEAICNLGWMRERGFGGLTKDENEAAKLYQQAADLGHTRGMYNTAWMFEFGCGGKKKDLSRALDWYRKAANNGDSKAMWKVGKFYDEAIGVSEDDAAAVEWYSKSAAAGSLEAMSDLALMYEFGRGGLRKDERLAVSWYEKAAVGGNALAMRNLGNMHERGLGGLQPSDIAAVEWYRRSSEAGEPWGMCDLARMYSEGRGGLKRSVSLALQLLKKADEGGDPRADALIKQLERVKK
jgi:TPR repeat protein